MVQPTIALMDTSFLANCLKLKKLGFDIFPSLRLLTNHVLIPLEIRKEVENYRPPETRTEEINEFLNDLNLSNGFYRLCTNYDTMILNELMSIIDNGEAELIAQAQKREEYWIWIDNTRDTKKVENSYTHFHFHNIITVVYLLYYKGILPYTLDEIMVAVHRVYNHGIDKRTAADEQAKRWLSL